MRPSRLNSTRRVSTIFTDHTGRCFLTLSIFLIVVSWGGAQRLDACTGKIKDLNVCVCNNDDQVRCIGHTTLKNVPVNFPQSTTRIAVIQTSVNRIERNDFTGLEKVEVLFLQQNQIEYIDEFAFRNMYRLQTLNLEKNRLSQLDPQGMLFQHLPSLSYLVLINNVIKTMNRYSFLTAVSRENKKLQVRMFGNRVHCDCNVLAIKNWIDDVVPAGQISIENLLCENDVVQRTLDQISAASPVFGSCPAKRKPFGDLSYIFNTMFTCANCEKESTNHACNLRPHVSCTGLQMVCLRTVRWSEEKRDMSVTSRCEQYTSCLDREARNADHCGRGYQSNGNVTCEFCCMGPTCQSNSIGGRTYDITYFLTYVKKGPFEKYMIDATSARYQADERRITAGVKSEFQSVKAGVDVYLEYIIPKTLETHSVVLRIEITALTFEDKSDILKALSEDMEKSVVKSSGFLFQENVLQDSVSIGDGNCSFSRTSSPKGTYEWSPEKPGSIQLLLCVYLDRNSKSIYARRSCLPGGLWGPVEDEECPANIPPTNPVDPNSSVNPTSRTTTKSTTSSLLDQLNEIVNSDVTPDNVLDVATNLSEITEKKRKVAITPEILNKWVIALEDCVKPGNLKQPGVAEKVVLSLSNVLDVDFAVMQDGQEEEDTSNRIMIIIDTVAEKGPLNAGQMKIVTPNLALAAQAIDERESREITMVANTNSLATGELESNQISVAFTDKSRQPSLDRTNLVLPIPALIQSLTPSERSQLARASFVVHRSDKLFAKATSTVPQSMLTPESGNNQAPSRTVSDGSDSGGTLSSTSGKSPKTRRFVTIVNSMVLSASVPDVKVQGLSENVTITFKHQSGNTTSPRCVFWDMASNDWSSEGCGIVTSSPDMTQCGCNHLTNFALLMDVYQEGTGLSSLDREILSYISYIGCGVSLAALLLTLATYALFRKLRRDNPSKILINLCLALLLSNLVYLAGMHDYSFDNSTACKVVAVLLHYSLLASLTWMAVEAFYMYLALILVFKTYFSNFILKCSLFGWGVPLLIVIATLAVDSTDNYGFINSGMCWLRNPAFYVAFVGPVGLILLVNCIAFALVIRQLSNMASSKLNKTDRNGTMQRLRGAIGIVILLGLTWIFAIFAIGKASTVFYYLFAIFNSLQGLFIFIFYCVLKKDAISAWKRVLPCFEEYGESSKSTSNSRDSAGVSQSAANINAVNMRYRAASPSTLHGTNSTSTTTTSVGVNSRKASVTTILEHGNMYHTIDDADIYTNVEYGPSVTLDSKKPPSYSAGSESHVTQGFDNPAMQRNPYSVAQPTAYTYRNENVSPNKSQFSPSNQINGSKQPYGPVLSYSERQDKQQEIPRPHVDGEIDSSNLAKVREIRIKYERTMSQTSDFQKSNI